MRCRERCNSDCFFGWRPPDGAGAGVVELRQGTPHEKYRCLVRYCKSLAPALIATPAPWPRCPPGRGAGARTGQHRARLAFPPRRLPWRLAPARRADRRQRQTPDDNLESWAETGLATGQGDTGLAGRGLRREQGLLATRLVGRTHYLVAQAGDGPGEISATGNRRTRKSPATPCLPMANRPPWTTARPATARPQRPSAGPAVLCLPPRGQCRRLCGACAPRTPNPAPSTACWKTSSVQRRRDFCNHWVLAMSEHQDRFLQSVFRAKPISTLEGHPPAFHGEQGQDQRRLARRAGAYDRACRLSDGLVFPYAGDPRRAALGGANHHRRRASRV